LYIVFLQALYSSALLPDQSLGELTVTKDVNSCVLCNLTAFAQYKISLSASTSKGWGSAASVNAWTEICSPDVPPAPVVNSTGQQTLIVVLQPAVLSCGPISGYFVAVAVTEPNNNTIASSRQRRSVHHIVRRALPDPVRYIPLSAMTVAQFAPSDITKNRLFVVGDGNMYNGYQNAPLNSENYYIVYYVVASSFDNITKMAFSESVSPVRPDSSAPSMTTTFTAQHVTTTSQPGLSEAAKIAIGVLVPVGFLLIAALLILILYFCWWKKRHHKPAGGQGFNLSWLQYYTNNFGTMIGSNSKWTNIAAVDEPRYVNVDNEMPSDLSVTDMHHSRPGISFVDEYKMLPTGMTFPCTVAGQPENSELNRFPHLLAYDHSRVVLESSVSASTYINANYLPGYDRRRKAYIAAQSPFNKQTICDFWLMVYQEHVSQVDTFV
jgi:Protein-tyrosine phosphatase